MDVTTLIEALAGLEPVELKGVELLREFRSRSPGWLPEPFDESIDRGAIVCATVELIEYGDACRAALQRLGDLSPVTLDEPVLEYGL